MPGDNSVITGFQATTVLNLLWVIYIKVQSQNCPDVSSVDLLCNASEMMHDGQTDR